MTILGRLSAITVFCAPTLLWAQAPVAAAPKVTRADLAAAYMRVDAAYTQRETAKTLPDSLRAAVNRTVDRAALSFFSGQFAAAVGTIDAAAAQLTGTASVPPAPPTGPRSLNGAPASAARNEYLARLAVVDSTGPLAQALLSTRERAKLLVDVPSPERSAEFLNDPVKWSRELAREGPRKASIPASGDGLRLVSATGPRTYEQVAFRVSYSWSRDQL